MTNESVEVIRSLAFELKYSEEITMFMFNLAVVFVLLIVCKRRLLLAERVLMKAGVTVMLTFCRAVT